MVPFWDNNHLLLSIVDEFVCPKSMYLHENPSNVHSGKKK